MSSRRSTTSKSSVSIEAKSLISVPEVMPNSRIYVAAMLGGHSASPSILAHVNRSETLWISSSSSGVGSIIAREDEPRVLDIAVQGNDHNKSSVSCINCGAAKRRTVQRYCEARPLTRCSETVVRYENWPTPCSITVPGGGRGPPQYVNPSACYGYNASSSGFLPPKQNDRGTEMPPPDRSDRSFLDLIRAERLTPCQTFVGLSENASQGTRVQTCPVSTGRPTIRHQGSGFEAWPLQAPNPSRRERF